MASLPVVLLRIPLLFAILLGAIASSAEESPSPTPSSTPEPSPAPSTEVAKSVRIRFLPPPMEGTISLGVYDATGTLVRVLHREADLEEFEIGSDALSTSWDGKNDAGEAMSPGKYHARGYAVGGVTVDGVGFFFNDWVTDAESPHVEKIHNLRLVSDKELALLVTLAGGQEGSVTCDLSGELIGNVETTPNDERFLPDRCLARVADGKVLLQRASGWEEVAWPNLTAPLDAAAGKDGTVWVIDRAEAEPALVTLKQFSPEGALLRQMMFPAGEPQPKIVTASTTSDEIFLLEENAARQRVRGLALVATTAANDPTQQPVSDWNVEFEKEIIAHQRFVIVSGKPVVGPDPAEVEKVTVKLRPNPLEKGASATVDLALGFDAEGSFVKTTDGLPLQTVSDTPYLVRVVLSPNSATSIDVFQDDNAVVEQFRVNALDQMMAFDCGEIELK